MKIPSAPFTVALVLLCSLLAGCANVGRVAQHSDGLLDFVAALAGRPRRDVVAVERLSSRSGEIVTAHAEPVRPGRTRVSGTVRNGFGYGDTTHAHVDVKVLAPGTRMLIAALATDYSPRPIPHDYRGQPRRATFSARLPFVPAAGSTIQVAFHQSRRADCEFDRTDARQP